MMTFNFPVGYHKLHKTKIIDYQLNRWYSLGYADLNDMRVAASRIRKLEDWKGEMVRQAEKALAEGRLMNGTFYLRAAEFFVPTSDPDKARLYERFIDLFYNHLCKDEPLSRHKVPYEGAYLPALRVPGQTSTTQGTLVVHGGFDSFIEEFYSIATSFAARGYDVILFEGPGQGGALRHYDLPLTYQWEKPAKAVLDYFEVEDVSWMGISMGGWMCFRAAAFETRIKRVIASSIAYDYMAIPPKPVADFARWLMKHERTMNWMSEMKMKARAEQRWGIENMMAITKSSTPLKGSKYMLEFNAQNQHADQVTQDVLILTGAEDHFIPLKMHYLQIAALTNARSVTGRIFTSAEQGQNHCQVGNFGLAMQEVAQWIAEKERVQAVSVPL